jgi:hypothetical protein
MIGCYHFPNNPREANAHTPDGGRDKLGIADRLNFSAPEAYVARDQDWAKWEAVIGKRLEVARSFDRPSYAFLNTTHIATPYEAVDEATLRRAIAFIRPRADGIIWWGGWHWVKPKGGGPEVFRRYPWSDDDPWLKAIRPDAPPTRPRSPHPSQPPSPPR